MLAPLSRCAPFSVAEEDAGGVPLPSGLSRPILAVPAANLLRCLPWRFMDRTPRARI